MNEPILTAAQSPAAPAGDRVAGGVAALVACVSAAAAAILYRLLAGEAPNALLSVGPALVGGAAFLAINVGLLSLAMGLSEGTRPVAVWRERLRWMTPYGLASGPLAAALVIAYQKTGVVGLIAFAVPPAFMMFSVQQYLAKTRQSVEEVRRANVELQGAIV